MGIAQEGLMTVRAQLCDQIDGMLDQLGHLTPGQLATRIDDIRTTARDYGLTPLEALAHGLESRLSTLASGPSIKTYLVTMRDAVGCERVDAEAVQAYLAVMSQRF
jgi:hypothetical protein